MLDYCISHYIFLYFLAEVEPVGLRGRFRGSLCQKDIYYKHTIICFLPYILMQTRQNPQYRHISSILNFLGKRKIYRQRVKNIMGPHSGTLLCPRETQSMWSIKIAGEYPYLFSTNQIIQKWPHQNCYFLQHFSSLFPASPARRTPPTPPPVS